MRSTQHRPRYVFHQCRHTSVLVTQRSRTGNHLQRASTYRPSYRSASTSTHASSSRAAPAGSHLVRIIAALIVVSYKLTTHTVRAPRRHTAGTNEPECLRASRVPGEYASRLCSWLALGPVPHADTRSSPASAATHARIAPSSVRDTWSLRLGVAS